MTWDQAVALFITPAVVALFLFLVAIWLSRHIPATVQQHSEPEQRSPASLAGD